MTPIEPCCQRFATAHIDPAQFLRERPGIDLATLSRSRAGALITTTARGLVLRRDGLVQHDSEQVLGPDGWMPTPWHHDTYCGGLGLLEPALEQWTDQRILDVGSGLGLFPTEASALGAHVDATDSELDDTHASFEAARTWVARHFGEQVALLRCLSQHAKLPRYAMSSVGRQLVRQLHDQRRAIAESYPSVSGRRFVEDARSLRTVDDASYDLVVCGWLMTHLDETDERRVFETLVRVTRSGGQLRIKAGWGADAAERYARWLRPDGLVGGRVVALHPSSAGDLVIANVC